MSEPKRYEPDHEGLMCPTPKGNYVLMQDYARLKAEVERLTKAGDAIVSFLWAENGDESCNGGITYIAEKAEIDWYYAKKGGQP